MNKKFTLPIFLFFIFVTMHLQAQDLVKICITTQLDEPVGQVEFTTSGTNATQIDNDANGCYQFEVDATSGNLNLLIKKDINPLNGVDIADLFFIASGLLGMTTFSPFQIKAGDTNGSETLTSFDIVVVRRILLGIDPGFPVNVDSWQFFEPNLSPTNSPISASQIQIATPIGGTEIVDILGVKTGDVNLSADPSMFTSPTSDDRSGDLIFKTEDALYATDEVFEVPISFDNFSKLRGLQLTTEFDTDLLKFQQIITGTLPDHSINSDFNLENTAEGFINTIWFDQTSEGIDMTPDDILFTLQFKAKSNLLLSDVLSVNSTSTKAIAYNADNEPFGIVLEFENEITSTETFNSNVKLKSNFPNPFQISTQIEFYLPTEEYVRLEITDALGRIVDTLIDGDQSAGEHQIIFSPDNLTTGIYFSNLIVGKNQLIQKIIYLP